MLLLVMNQLGALSQKLYKSIRPVYAQRHTLQQSLQKTFAYLPSASKAQEQTSLGDA
jgi:hypothetical protein